MFSRMCFSVLFLTVCSGFASSSHIIISEQASPKEIYAARELQRYLYHITGDMVSIDDKISSIRGKGFVLGVKGGTAANLFAESDLIDEPEGQIGEEGYILKKINYRGGEIIAVTGGSGVGCMYGVYGLLDDYYDVGFYFSGDILPEQKRELYLPDVDEVKNPAVYIRGFLPWTNFPQSATVYSWQDWRYIIDTAAKMRMNFIHVHNYNFGKQFHGHNEMYHNFEYKGYLSRVWMATARSGHMWRGEQWNIEDYLWGAADLFDDYDFGSDAAIHNETLSNQEVFDKGRSMFQKVIAYAHERGVKIGLGLDIDLIPNEYTEKFGVKADDPELVAARVEQITSDYPNLDVLLCFHSEGPQDKKDFWQGIFRMFYEGMKEKSPQTKIAVAGWGLKPEFVEGLPEDVICAPISAYSDKCVSGSEYGEREYWGCPWLERDFNSSEYYYPYNVHLSNTIEAWNQRASNMKGLYCLTWRLTDAIDPKISYIAKAPWDSEGRYSSSEAVYSEYARRSYGENSAAEITGIINENEPFASGFGECRPTPEFSGSTRPNSGEYLFNISKFKLADSYSGKYSRFQAVDYRVNRGTQNAGCSEGGECVGYIQHGNWLKYEPAEISAAMDSFEVRAASATNGGAIEIRLDNPDGPILGVCEIPNTGGWQNWQTFQIDMKPLKPSHGISLTFAGPEINDLPKAVEQLAVIDRCLANTGNPAYRARLEKLRCRIQATHDHIVLEQSFPYIKWNELPGAFESWARSFTHRVDDISSLGNVQSSQNRFVQLRYLGMENSLRQKQQVKAPAYVTAKGTKTGALIQWRNPQVNVVAFNVYRDGEKINDVPLGAGTRSYTDRADGVFEYTVTAIGDGAAESPHSVAYKCLAGDADDEAPLVVVISEPVSVMDGQSVEITARILDGRSYDCISANLYYRKPGAFFWSGKTMKRRNRAVFCCNIEASKISEQGIEYYIKASDGSNHGFFPAAAPDQVLTCIESLSVNEYDLATPELRAEGTKIIWKSCDNAFWYKIYRGENRNFKADGASFVTYVYKDTLSFEDNGLDFNAMPLEGDYYYRVTAVDFNDNESRMSNSVKSEPLGGDNLNT
jgi:hypothetical protein